MSSVLANSSDTMYKSQLFVLVLCETIISIHVYGSPATKRGIFEDGFGAGVHPVPEFGNSALVHEFNNFQGGIFPFEQSPQPASAHILIPKQFGTPKLHSAPSTAEIAAAVTAAKEASANVMAAQQRVQVAKEDVVNQQKIASHKEVQAALALQQTEAAAAVQRQQASSAANAVVSAQQRLAQAKADVAEHQRIASEKESAAAEAIQRSAAAASEEIKKSDNTAAKLAAYQSSEAASALKHADAAKGATLSATSAALAAAIGHNAEHGFGPWFTPGKVTHFAPWG